MLPFAVACMALLVASLDPLIQFCRALLEQCLGNKLCKNSVEVGNEYVCSDDECVTRNDIADSDAAEDEKEEVSESLDLFDSYVQGFVLSHGRQLLKRKKKQLKSKKKHIKRRTKARLQMSVCYG
jgi:hypothetical protein